MKTWYVIAVLWLQGACATHAVPCATRLRPINPPPASAHTPARNVTLPAAQSGPRSP